MLADFPKNIPASGPNGRFTTVRTYWAFTTFRAYWTLHLSQNKKCKITIEKKTIQKNGIARTKQVKTKIAYTLDLSFFFVLQHRRTPPPPRASSKKIENTVEPQVGGTPPPREHNRTFSKLLRTRCIGIQLAEDITCLQARVKRKKQYDVQGKICKRDFA